MNDDLFILQQSSLFRGYNSTQIVSLLSSVHYRIRNFSSQEIIFTVGEPAATLGIVLTGLVDVRKEFWSGKSLVVTCRGPGELLADAAMFAGDGLSYPGTLFACCDSRVLLLPKGELRRLFALDSQILFNFLQSVSQRMLALNQKIEILALHSIQSKIAYYLLRKSEACRSSVIVLPFSKKSWAEHLNVSRTSLSRELRRLEADAVLSFSQRRIRILQPSVLQNLLTR